MGPHIQGLEIQAVERVHQVIVKACTYYSQDLFLPLEIHSLDSGFAHLQRLIKSSANTLLHSPISQLYLKALPHLSMITSAL